MYEVVVRELAKYRWNVVHVVTGVPDLGAAVGAAARLMADPAYQRDGLSIAVQGLVGKKPESLISATRDAGRWVASGEKPRSTYLVEAMPFAKQHTVVRDIPTLNEACEIVGTFMVDPTFRSIGAGIALSMRPPGKSLVTLARFDYELSVGSRGDSDGWVPDIWFGMKIRDREAKQRRRAAREGREGREGGEFDL